MVVILWDNSVDDVGGCVKLFNLIFLRGNGVPCWADLLRHV